jgi:hypothetical protein
MLVTFPLEKKTHGLLIENHEEKHTDSDARRFRLSARPKYPTRTCFTTGSTHKTEHELPQNSFCAIEDEYGEEMIIDFDSTCTKMSAATCKLV